MTVIDGRCKKQHMNKHAELQMTGIMTDALHLLNFPGSELEGFKDLILVAHKATNCLYKFRIPCRTKSPNLNYLFPQYRY
jgi:hypothetical protein